MTVAATRRLAISGAMAAAALISACGPSEIPQQNRQAQAGEAASEQQPKLMLLTTLPLVFADSFSLDGGGSSALEAMEARYDIVPISTTAASELAKGGLLLMAHPLAQPAESLVDLDAWVRAGGRLLLLADPMLEWESERPLGDALRPPPSFADTGLLAHWGLRLDAPDERGPKQLPLGEHRVLTASPGVLSGNCSIDPPGLVARCRIGEGVVTVIADADFLDVQGLDGPTSDNLTALIAELDSLARR